MSVAATHKKPAVIQPVEREKCCNPVSLPSRPPRLAGEKLSADGWSGSQLDKRARAAKQLQHSQIRYEGPMQETYHDFADGVSSSVSINFLSFASILHREVSCRGQECPQVDRFM